MPRRPRKARTIRKEEMVHRLNELLEMEHRLNVWQFLHIRKYELEEMVSKIEDLYCAANGHRGEGRAASMYSMPSRRYTEQQRLGPASAGRSRYQRGPR